MTNQTMIQSRNAWQPHQQHVQSENYVAQVLEPSHHAHLGTSIQPSSYDTETHASNNSMTLVQVNEPRLGELDQHNIAMQVDYSEHGLNAQSGSSPVTES